MYQERKDFIVLSCLQVVTIEMTRVGFLLHIAALCVDDCQEMALQSDPSDLVPCIMDVDDQNLDIIPVKLVCNPPSDIILYTDLIKCAIYLSNNMTDSIFY